MYDLNYLIDMVVFSLGIEAFYVQKNDQVYSHLGNIFCEHCPLNIYHECQVSWRIGDSISKKLNRPYIYLCPLGLSFVILSNPGIKNEYCLQHDFLVIGPTMTGVEAAIDKTALQACRYQSPDGRQANLLDEVPYKQEDILLHIADLIHLAYRAVICCDSINKSTKGTAQVADGIDMSHNLLDYTHKLSEMLFGSIAASENEIGEIIDEIMKIIQLEEYGNLKRIRDKSEKIYIYLYSIYNKNQNGDPSFTQTQILERVNKIAAADTFEETVKYFTDAADLLYRNQNRAASKSDNQLIKRMQDIVAEQYMSQTSLASVAREMNVSYSYLSSLIKKNLGRGFNQYLKEVRVQASKALLCDSALSIAEIAHRVGFADQSHYSKSFRAIAGMPPQQYRSAKHEKPPK